MQSRPKWKPSRQPFPSEGSWKASTGVCRDISLGLPKPGMPIGMKRGFGKGLRDYLSLNIHSCGYSFCFRQVLLRTWGCCGQGL